MKIFEFLKSLFCRQGKALSLYQRGKTKAKKHDHLGAVSDFTASIDVPDAPSDVKAIALYNRALEHVATGDYQDGVDDLDAVLAMVKAPMSVKRMAQRKLVKRESRFQKSNV